MTEAHAPAWERRAFAAATLASLVPLFLLYLLPTQDGPVHTYNAELVRQYLAGEGDWFSALLAPNPRFDPPWVPRMLLVAWVALFGPGPAELIYQALCVLLIPWALRYAITAFAPGQGHFAWLGLPMAWSVTFHLGFYAFSIGLSAALWMLGFWRRSHGRWTARRIAAMAAVAVAAFYAHVYPLLLAGILILPLALQRLVACWRARGMAAALRAELLPQLLAFAPVMLLIAEFLLARQTEVVADRPLPLRLAHLASLSWLLVYDNTEVVGSVAVAGTIGLLSLRALRAPDAAQPARDRALLAGVLAVMGVFFTLPETMLVSPNGMRGGSFLIERTQPMIWFGLILWCALRLADARWRPLVVAAGLLLTAIGFALRAPVYAELRAQLAEYDYAGEHVRPRELVLALNAFRGGVGADGRGPLTRHADPFRHRVDWIALRTGAFAINNYEAVMGYFPLVYRDHANPWIALGEIEAEPPVIRLADYERAIGRPLDVVLVWGAGFRGVDMGDVLRQLDDAGFVPMARSPGRGLMVVYRRAPQ